MKPAIAPTSPKARPPLPDMTSVWPEGAIVQPPKTPWFRLSLLMVLVGCLAGIGAMLSVLWFGHRYPQTFIGHWLQTIGSSTTIIQPVKEREPSTTPTAVTKVATSLFGLTVGQEGVNVVYTSDMVQGQAVPLSSSGWLLTVDDGLPSGQTQLAAAQAIGSVLPITTRVADPATPFVFLRTADTISQAPVTFAASDAIIPNAKVWVVGQYMGQTTIVQRTLIAQANVGILDTDHQLRSWTLDAAVPIAAGAAVVNTNGDVIGLLGANTRVWIANELESVLKDVFRTSTINRPTFGARYIDLSTALTTSNSPGSGAQISGPAGTPAVTPKSPVATAGLQTGDIITTVNGQTLNGDLYGQLRQFQPGDTLTLDYLRQGKAKHTTLRLGTLAP